jgi:rhamnose utilization protein RhaD (predicted bifunctional aldolase and dehydrogenase)/NAD(P)-dependent dehydrogenase (short-subunit alcohol dehydrogenase family)
MKNLWSNETAARFEGDLNQRVYSSRLLGREPTLVLHGGGNTSVKVTEKNLFGADEAILYVKGSGADLEHIEAGGYSPVRLAALLKLAELPSLSDPEMVNALRTSMTRADAPTPSVEAILHAILPYKYVDHTHADSVLAVMNCRDGEARIREIYGDGVVVIPYVMPGFDLARSCAMHFPALAGPRTTGMILLHHGVFSFGNTARESYERMIDLVTRAEDYLAKHNAWTITQPSLTPGPAPLRREIAALRREISAVAGFPLVLSAHTDSRSLAFVRRDDIAKLSQQGPATPDHVIRTKRLPLLGRDVAGYADAYRKYFEAYAAQAKEPKTMLDPAPRVVLDPQLGICTLGRSAKDAAIVHDIYSHTMDIVLRTTRLGGYQALPANDLFDMEYWDLEQAKLRKSGKPPMFAGEVALVTGAASGIGRACVDSLLARGAAVIGLDIDPAITKLHARPDFFGLACDVADEPRLTQAIEQGVRAFGGLDMLILNAGVFPPGTHVESLATGEWHKVMRVNLDANLALLRETQPLLKLAPRGGRVAVIGSKNVPAPGPGAAAYSASKAALQQLARVAALEWAGDGIRINTLHPDAVFDTGIWTEEVLMARAAHYGMTVEGYKRKNLLKTEITSRDVAELAAELCGPLFSKTTGAQIPVDGGSDRVI